VTSPRDITQLLQDYRTGDRAALDTLLPLVYDELRRLAGNYLQRERSDHTLQPTALVHEAYMRLVDQRNVDWQNRAQFFGIAAEMMRRILVNYARDRQAEKRGGGERRVSLDEAISFFTERDVNLITLDDALNTLATLDPQQARIVELRFFGGLKNEEVAEVLGVSEATVSREWRKAKMWLASQFTPTEQP
jgi:RNA polymerase sigma factor (TIGR02999 family)